MFDISWIWIQEESFSIEGNFMDRSKNKKPLDSELIWVNILELGAWF